MQDFVHLFQLYVKSELMVLVPVLYIINQFVGKSSIKPKYIPALVSAISIALCLLYTLATEPVADWKGVMMVIFTSVTQGVIYAGASIFGDVLLNPCSFSQVMCKKSRNEKEDKS